MGVKKRWEIAIAGEGGQGLVLAGQLLGEAAALQDGKNAVQTSAYGVASRGGFAKADVIISEDEIAYPKVRRPDAVVALSQEAYNRYKKTLEPGCILLYDSGAIQGGESAAKEYPYPLLEIAREAGGPRMLNLVSLGALVALTGAVSKEGMLRVLEGRFSKDGGKAAGVAFEAGFAVASSFGMMRQ